MPPNNNNNNNIIRTRTRKKKRRSRAIWDETRRPHDNVMDLAVAYCRAVLYELQPIRFSTLTKQIVISDLVLIVQRMYNTIKLLTTKWIPAVIYHVAVFVWNRPIRQWGYVGLTVLYYGFVRWIHDVLDAGPVMIIITLLAIIFTVGLGDESEQDGGQQRVSAYSVFNRGFERLMGSVDADSLLAQYTGGGMMPMNPGGGGGGVADAAGFDARRGNGNEIVNRRRNPRRNDDDDNAGNDGRNDDDDDDDENNNNVNNRARRSGKKARRQQKRNQRRQQQHQDQNIQEERLVDGDVGGDDNNVDIDINDEDMVAMQHVIENQIRMDGNE